MLFVLCSQSFTPGSFRSEEADSPLPPTPADSSSQAADGSFIHSIAQQAGIAADDMSADAVVRTRACV